MQNIYKDEKGLNHNTNVLGHFPKNYFTSVFGSYLEFLCKIKNAFISDTLQRHGVTLI